MKCLRIEFCHLSNIRNLIRIHSFREASNGYVARKGWNHGPIQILTTPAGSRIVLWPQVLECIATRHSTLVKRPS